MVCHLKEVNSLLFDNTGYLWTATQSGLNRYDGYNFVQFPLLKNGQRLPNDQQIKSIRKDNKGNLWMLAEEGLSRMQFPKQGKSVIIHYISPT